MARKPISMNKITEIQRLKDLGFKERKIARSLKMSRKTVAKYLTAAAPVLGPPLAQINFDWADVIQEHTLSAVPLTVLHQELVDSEKTCWTYSYFWKQYQKIAPSSSQATMARVHAIGERAEIDYCDGINLIDLATGEVIKTQFFVGVLCHSRYTFAEFSYSQKSLDFLNSHVRMFNFFGGTPRQLSPDNLRSAVNKSNRYDPEINPAYQRLADHYKIAVVPARVRRPQDKAIVERTIQIFQKWFYFVVRKRVFSSLLELNKVLADHLEKFNLKKHRLLGCSRSEAFEKERPHLSELPSTEFAVRTHKQATLHNDCHIQFDGNFYSAPWNYRGQQLDVWCCEKRLEIFYNGELLAQHARKLPNRYSHCTNNSHYPPSHKAYLEVSPQNLLVRAKEAGPQVEALVEALLKIKFPLRHLRKVEGILALLKKYSQAELNYACGQALTYNRPVVRFIEALAKSYKGQIETKNETPERGTNQFLRQQELLQ